MAKTTAKDLKPAELNFANYILQGLNQTEAVQLAYPNVKKKTYANVKARRLIQNDLVSEYIESKKQEIAVKAEEIVLNDILETKKLYFRSLNEGKLSVAARLLDQLHKICGSYTDNRPNPEQVKQKAIEAQRSAELAAMVERAIDMEYNGVKHVECIEQPVECLLDAPECPVSDEQAKQEDKSEET